MNMSAMKLNVTSGIPKVVSSYKHACAIGIVYTMPMFILCYVKG